MNLALILKQPQRDRMHGGIPPPLVKEPPRPIQMVEIILVRPAAPKLHVGDLEVAPEMTGRVTVGLFVVLGPALLVLQPGAGAVGWRFQVLRVGLGEAHRLGPEGRHGFGVVVEVDGEAVGFVAVVHVAEDVVVDVAEEMHLGFDAPVIADVFQCRVVVEDAAVPAAHLVVGDQVAVLGAFVGEDLAAFAHEVLVDPGGDGPVFWRDDFVVAGGAGFGAGFGLEFFVEGFVVEEGPGIVEFVVPGSFEVAHGCHHPVDFFVADEGEDGGVYAGRVGVVDGVIVGSP